MLHIICIFCSESSHIISHILNTILHIILHILHIIQNFTMVSLRCFIVHCHYWLVPHPSTRAQLLTHNHLQPSLQSFVLSHTALGKSPDYLRISAPYIQDHRREPRLLQGGFDFMMVECFSLRRQNARTQESNNQFT